MNPLILGPILEVGKRLIDNLFPDPAAKAKAELDMMILLQTQDLQKVMGQLEINAAEAANPSIFVAGRRPARQRLRGDCDPRSGGGVHLVDRARGRGRPRRPGRDAAPTQARRMIPIVGQTGPELYVALVALATSLVGAVVALLKLGPERQVTLVGAQDTVIDNLREEIDRQRVEHKIALDAMESRHRVRIAELERQLAEEAETCERRIDELKRRLGVVEKRSTGRRTR